MNIDRHCITKESFHPSIVREGAHSNGIIPYIHCKGGGRGGLETLRVSDDRRSKARLVPSRCVPCLASALVISSFLCAFLTAASSFGAFMGGLASFLFFAILVALVGLIVAIIPAHFGRSRHSVSAIIRVIWHCHI